MKKILFLIFIMFAYTQATFAVKDSLKTALLIIDIQDFYFPGHESALANPEDAAKNAAEILKKFRNEKLPVIHVWHEAKAGAGIFKSVAPITGEKVFSKTKINAFRETGLLEYLKSLDIKRLVICGMQTQLCVEAATRAAADYGFTCVLVKDACAAKDLEFDGVKTKAAEVHNSTLAILSIYAEVLSTKDFLTKY